MSRKNTKIVCTLGPSSDSISEIEALVKAGLNLARLNFSHGNHPDHKRILTNLRKVESRTGKTIGIIQDLQGPKIRIGKMPKQGIAVKKGQTCILTMQNILGEIKAKTPVFPVQYKNLVNDVKAGDTILINDGLIELTVQRKSSSDIICRVKTGGLVESNKGINVPTASINAACITEKDKKDIAFGLKNNVDYIALSFVKSAADIKALRKIIQAAGKQTKIIAKIERHEAIKNLREIIKEADALMVARGDMGVEIPAEQVPVVQKQMLRLANEERKPVITATQVLQSMVENPRATRAEISDAANAVYDHTDAIMLSNESAVGKYAYKAVATLRKIAEEIEKDQKNHKKIIENIYINTHTPTDAMCLNAVKLANEINAKFIAAYTNSGYTARELTKPRTFMPIITITPSLKTKRELTLVWGINEVLVQNIPGGPSDKIKKISALLKKKKLVKSGEEIVIICNAGQKEKFISTCKI